MPWVVSWWNPQGPEENVKDTLWQSFNTLPFHRDFNSSCLLRFS